MNQSCSCPNDAGAGWSPARRWIAAGIAPARPARSRAASRSRWTSDNMAFSPASGGFRFLLDQPVQALLAEFDVLQAVLVAQQARELLRRRCQEDRRHVDINRQVVAQ